jgi:hypothetical protein
MGFDIDICKEALGRYDWDINLATNYLLGGWTNAEMHKKWIIYVDLQSWVKERERWTSIKQCFIADSLRTWVMSWLDKYLGNQTCHEGTCKCRYMR